MKRPRTVERSCEYCGEPFDTSRTNTRKRFCDRTCQTRALRETIAEERTRLNMRTELARIPEPEPGSVTLPARDLELIASVLAAAQRRPLREREAVAAWKLAARALQDRNAA